MVRPRLLVNAPSFTPLPYGLLSVVETPPAVVGNHWQNGVSWQSRCMTSTMGSATYDECIAVTGSGGPPPAPSTKTDNVDLIMRGATAFTPFVKFDCSPVGLDDAVKVATDSFNQSAGWQIERAFWSGVVDSKTIAFPHLTSEATVSDEDGILLQTIPVTGGPFDPADAIGFLEAQLGNCLNGVGVLHVPQRALATLDAWGLVKSAGGRLKTLGGNYVAVGTGYPGTSPSGSAPTAGEIWLYATGPVFALQGAIRVNRVPESFDRANNTVEMIAERTVVLGFDCCHAGVRLTMGVPT